MAALPSSPNLQYYRKQAKALLRSHSAGNSAASERLRRHHPRLAGATDEQIRAFPLALADAQWAVARECGFESWPRLKRQIELVAGRSHARAFETDPDYYADRARGLVSVHQSGLPSALLLIREFHPGFAGASEAEIRQAPFAEADAQLVYARQHGFSDWAAFMEHVAGLASGKTIEPFRLAFRAIRDADLAEFQRLLAAHPDLVNARGTNGNTLLNLVAGHLTNGNHSRAPEPGQDPNALRHAMIRTLLQLGADVDLGNDRGSTALHGAGYGNLTELAQILVEAGASTRLEAHGKGGTPLAMALFWGNREVAAYLAGVEVVPNNLRIAAATGRVDLLAAHFGLDGRLLPAAGTAREFHRPHSGFPVWSPSDSAAEILDEAFVWAAKAGETASLEFLLARGANIDGDPYRGTALLWAAFQNRVEAIRWLIARGATVDLPATFGGLSHGQGITALHLAAQCGHMESVRVLLGEGGADPTLPDALYRSPAWGWAAFHGQPEVRDYLLPIAARRELFAAVTLGDMELVRARIAEDPEGVSRLTYFTTPLARSVQAGHPQVARVLLDHGADPDQPDREGRTARQLAAEEGRPGWQAFVGRSASG